MVKSYCFRNRPTFYFRLCLWLFQWAFFILIFIYFILYFCYFFNCWNLIILLTFIIPIICILRFWFFKRSVWSESLLLKSRCNTKRCSFWIFCKCWFFIWIQSIIGTHTWTKSTLQIHFVLITYYNFILISNSLVKLKKWLIFFCGSNIFCSKFFNYLISTRTYYKLFC